MTGTLNRIGSYSVIDPSASGGIYATCQDALLNSSFDFAGAASAPSSLCHVKAFTTVNLSASYRWNPHLTFIASINNLTDANAPRDFQTYGGSFLPYNPALDQDGVIGRFFQVGLRYKY